MRLRGIAIFAAVALMLMFCTASWGQVLKGSISGTVLDPQGAAVANAQIKATEKATSTVTTTTSDGSGNFRLNLLPVGFYRLDVSASGFKTTVINDVQVTAGVDTNIPVKMTLGESSTTIEITAEAPLIETTQAQVSNTFSGTTLQTFAGIQENQGLDNLALFVPGVSSVRDNSFSNTNGGVGFSVDGLRGRNNDQEIDGQNNNDNSVAGPSLFVSDTEFVAQYVIVTNQFGPEYGRNSGSVVNIITKSGTNNWHGSVYGTENNSVLNSLNNFQKNAQICGTDCLTSVPRSNDEFAGFTVGGPIVKNKAFFFGGFDQEIFSGQTLFTTAALTPTPAGLAALNACFPASASLAALNRFGPYAITAGNPQPLGTPQAGIVGTCPAATFAGVSREVPQPSHAFNFPLKVDFQSGSNTVSARYLFNKATFFNLGDNGAGGYFFNEPALSQAVLVSWTHNFGSHMVNEARVGFGRLNVDFGGGNLTGAAEPVAGQLLNALANISFNSVALLGFGPATNLPQSRIVNTWQFQDNWSYVMGKHTLKAGLNWTYQRSPNTFLPNINGAYRFSSWTSFMNNTPNRVRIADGDPVLDFREYDTFIYVGDDWKLTQHLTLNLGVTWTYYGQPANLFNDITTTRESSASTAFWSATEPVGTNNLGDTFTNPGAAIPLSSRTNPNIPAPKNNWGPSLGFAYSPQWGGFLTGHGKTVIRGGYRFLYDPPFYNIYLNNSTAAPFSFLNSVPAAATHPLPAVPTGPNVRASLASSIQTGVFDPREFAQTQITPDFTSDRVHSWSLGIQRELTKAVAFEARYAGNHGYGLFQTLDGNPYVADLQADFPSLVPAGTPAGCTTPLYTRGAFPGAFNSDPTGRVNCNFGVVRLRANSGYSNYNAIQTELRATNLFNQLTLRAAYTYSKTLDNVSEIFSTFAGGNSVFFAQNPANQTNGAGEYAFSGLDFPNQFTILFSEQLPFFKQQHGAIGHILGGWGLSGNFIWASGQRYTPIQGFAEAAQTANGDYYDFGYIANFAGVDTARPFLGSLSAPATSVGIFAGDANGFFGFGCPQAANQLISFTAFNATGACTPVTSSQVRFIINAAEAQAIFGTPFGNTPRNPVTDAPTSIGNFSVYKTIKFNERSSFTFHVTMLNVFNHSNYSSVDPFLEDAGLTGAFLGFGDPTQTPNVNTGAPQTRRIIFGGKITF